MSKDYNLIYDKLVNKAFIIASMPENTVKQLKEKEALQSKLEKEVLEAAKGKETLTPLKTMTLGLKGKKPVRIVKGLPVTDEINVKVKDLKNKKQYFK
jgi:hypothetical protein